MASLMERNNLNKCPPRQGNKSNRQDEKDFVRVRFKATLDRDGREWMLAHLLGAHRCVSETEGERRWPVKII